MKLRYFTLLTMGLLMSPLSAINAEEDSLKVEEAKATEEVKATEEAKATTEEVKAAEESKAVEEIKATEEVKATEEAKALATEKDKLSYSLGHNIAQSIKRQNVDIDVDLLSKGLSDVLTDGKSLLTEEEVTKVMQDFRKKQMEAMAKLRQEKAQKNLDEGNKFLEENKKKEGVKTLESGLQYRVVTEGKGNTPKATDKVTTHYRGKLLDGTEFDSSYKRNKPATFPVNGVIQGWQEALQLMKEGGKWELFIPANLAYGEQSRNPTIPPNSTLIFDIELISIEKEEAAKEAK